MQLDYDRPDYANVLRGADGASALVNERTLLRSFVIAPDRLVEDWPVSAASALAPADLEPVLAGEGRKVVAALILDESSFPRTRESTGSPPARG